MTFGHRGDLVVGVPRTAFRPSAVFLGILAVFAASGWMTWSGWGDVRFDLFLFVISGWLVSLCLHEYAHALSGYFAGDVGVAARGYLTLNPLKYTHPVLSLLLPVFYLVIGGIGLPGGAVWIDHQHIGGRWKDTAISLAGPGVNVVFTVGLAAPFLLGAPGATHPEFWAGVAFLGFLQLTASVLNLMPVPGVDGGNAVRPWLPADWRRGFDFVAPWGLLAFIGLLFNPRLNRLFFDFVDGLAAAVGLPAERYALGWQLFRFWTDR
jgi:Zn-dependent protease